MRFTKITILVAALVGYTSAGAIRPNDDLSAQRGSGGGWRGVNKRFSLEGNIPSAGEGLIKMAGHIEGMMDPLSKRQRYGTREDPYIVRMGGHQAGGKRSAEGPRVIWNQE